MSRIKNILRKGFLAVILLLVVMVLLGVLSRLTTPTAAQLEALALMERDELPDGPDAFGLWWTLGRDVPFDEIESVSAADAAQVAKWPEGWDLDSLEAPQTLSEVTEWRRDAYPSLSIPAEDRALFCSLNDDMPCLAKVREAPGETAEALARNSILVERTLRLRDTAVLRNALPHAYAPTYLYTSALMPMTGFALAFVQGDKALAIAETCRDLVTWRNLSTHTDMLIVAMSGIAYAGRGHIPLLADMLSEWPVERPLPAACDAALRAPAADELLLCHAIRGEFQIARRQWSDMTSLASSQGDWLDRVASMVAFDERSTAAAHAVNLAPYCRTDQPGRPTHDWPEPGWGQLMRWSCLGNMAGCVVTALARADAAGDYADRMQDFGARLRLLSTLSWMREQAAATGATADMLVERLPSELSNAEQPVELGVSGQTLRVSLFDDRRGKWAEVPLPAALIP